MSIILLFLLSYCANTFDHFFSVKTQLFPRGPAEPTHVLRKEHHSALRILKRVNTPHISAEILLPTSATSTLQHELSLTSVAKAERASFHEFAEHQRKLIGTHSSIGALLRPQIRAHSNERFQLFHDDPAVLPRDKRTDTKRSLPIETTDTVVSIPDRHGIPQTDDPHPGTSPAGTLPRAKEQREERKTPRREMRDYQSGKDTQRDFQQEKETERLNFLYRLIHAHASVSQTKEHNESIRYEHYSSVPESSQAAVRTLEHTIHVQVGRYFREDLSLPIGAKILCAVSGGADSMALLDILARLSRMQKYHLHVVHCNHQLRSQESADDAEFVKRKAEEYGLPCTIATIDVRSHMRKYGLSMEHAARSLRYECFAMLAEELSCSAVCTAHTSDDSAETFLLNLMRGSGLTGLSGMRMQRSLTHNAALIRPLLLHTKEELLSYNNSYGVTWREDSSNMMMVYTRNKIRHQLLPAIKTDFAPNIHETLTRTATILAGADDYIQKTVTRLIKFIAPEQKEFYTKISCSQLALHERFLQGEIIQHIATRLLAIPALSYSSVERILALLQSESGAHHHINKHWTAFRERDTLIIAKTAHHTLTPALIDTKKSLKGIILPTMSVKCSEIARSHIVFDQPLGVEFFDASKVSRTLMLRAWKPDDIFQPLGMTTPVTIGDFLANQKIPLHLRSSVPVLALGNEILWIIGVRISEKFKLQSTTITALRIEIQPNSVSTKQNTSKTESPNNETLGK